MTNCAAIAQVCRRVPEYPADDLPRSRAGLLADPLCALLHRHPHFLRAFRPVPVSHICATTWNAGALTLEQAQEIIDCVWIRFNDRGQICRENFYRERDDGRKRQQQARSGKTGMVIDKGPQSWTAGHRKRFQLRHRRRRRHQPLRPEHLCLSGIRPDGERRHQCADLLCLNSLEKFAFTSPVVTIRLHHASPPELVRRAAEVLKTGSGMPYINNDDVLIPAYTELGVTLRRCPRLRQLQLLGNHDRGQVRPGVDPRDELPALPGAGAAPRPIQRTRADGAGHRRPARFATFDDLMDAWKTQADYQLKAGIDYIGEGIANGTLEHSNHGKYSFNPLLSALTQDCIQNEQDVIRGGARYTIWHVMGEAVANAIDSMAAIKQMVYTERSLSMDELLDALDRNWDGYENLRNRLVARAPKFANDNDFADEIGQEMMSFFVDRTRFHAAPLSARDVPLFGGHILLVRHDRQGSRRHAGRSLRRRSHRRQLLAGAGRDMCGPTAAINSYLKMNVDHMAAGAPLDLRLAASSLKGEAGTQRLAGLIETFVDLGGNMLTFTVTDVEELKRAMARAGKIPPSARAHGRLVGLLRHAEQGAAAAAHPTRGARPGLIPVLLDLRHFAR